MKRQQVLQGLFGLAWLLLWLRLGQLQGWDRAYWKRRGEEIRIWEERLPARRGRILDRRGLELAENLPWTAKGPLTPALQARLAEQSKLGGTAIWPMRSYPQGAVCAQVVGYCAQEHPGQGDWQGRDGLEHCWDTQLKGNDGIRRWLVTAQGQRLRLIQEVPAQAGQDVTSSLDLKLQRVSFAALQSVLQQLGQVRARHDQPAGAVVAMEAASGEIRAMVSLPSYDPNLFCQPERSRDLQRLLDSQGAPLLNRAIAAQIPPASSFKLVTSTAALAQGLIEPGRRFRCTGVTWVEGVPFHCFVRRGHGELGFEQTLAQSCDCAYYELGLELGAPALLEWARGWGIGQLTGIGLAGEQAGYLADSRGCKSGELANLSIGQGRLLVTPLQMVRVAAAVATRGHLTTPRLLPGPSSQGLVIGLSAESWERVHQGLLATVEEGTASQAGARGLGLAGKTGTVENQPSGENPRGYNHTWFVGYHPRSGLALAIYLERSGGYGGSLAAPIAAQVVRAWTQD